MPSGFLFVGRPKNATPKKLEEEEAVAAAVAEEAEATSSYEDMSLKELKALCQDRGLGKLSDKGNWLAKATPDGKTLTNAGDIIAMLKSDDEA